MRFEGSSERNWSVWLIVRGAEVDPERSDSQVERERGVVR